MSIEGAAAFQMSSTWIVGPPLGQSPARAAPGPTSQLLQYMGREYACFPAAATASTKRATYQALNASGARSPKTSDQVPDRRKWPAAHAALSAGISPSR